MNKRQQKKRFGIRMAIVNVPRRVIRQPIETWGPTEFTEDGFSITMQTIPVDTIRQTWKLPGRGRRYRLVSNRLIGLNNTGLPRKRRERRRR